MIKVLVIEDEENIVTFLRRGLEEEGFEVFTANSGEEGIRLLKKTKIDLVVLDIILPGINGFSVCREIRSMGLNKVPILMLTALGTTSNLVKGLNTGADDYVSKPFKFIELVARINALLRRNAQPEKTESRWKIGNLSLNRKSRTAYRDDTEIKLTSTEYKLLEFFFKNRKKVLTRTDLLENVWGINFDISTNVVDVYVNYLRKKIDKGFEKKLIHTAVGMGYIMKEDDS